MFGESSSFSADRDVTDLRKYVIRPEMFVSGKKFEIREVKPSGRIPTSALRNALPGSSVQCQRPARATPFVLHAHYRE
ncbi:hypothetical protein EVAR_21191_1 [Eumeta japonica]|uniref:Uncharacterized protein n=1 Tax=Eumeta variegata TaxID=151549 RepID=A0A4C1UNP2_EUMVA|nr:hypothetical protein EVAR_21191_1 [Eumeta japonica]